MKRIVSMLLVVVLVALCALPVFAEQAAALPQVKKLAAKSITTAGKVSLTWKKVAGATGYEIYRKGPDETEYSLFKTVAKNKAGAKEHIVGGYVYDYRVRAFAKAGETTTYGEASEPLAVKFVLAPTQLKLTAGTGKVTVRFTPAQGAGKYLIYMRAKDEKSYTRLVTLKHDTHKYTADKLEAGQTYYFKARSFWKIGDKGFYSPWTKTKTVVVK